jgi:hypothetical protein
VDVTASSALRTSGGDRTGAGASGGGAGGEAHRDDYVALREEHRAVAVVVPPGADFSGDGSGGGGGGGSGGGGGGSSTAEREGDAAAVTRLCTELRLEQYVPALLGEGFDSLRALRASTEADLAAIGMRRGHMRTLLSALSLPPPHPPDATRAPTAATVTVIDIPGVRTLAPGDVLLDLEPVGRGSFGAVYRGTWHASVVAVKVLHKTGAAQLSGVRGWAASRARTAGVCGV